MKKKLIFTIVLALLLSIGALGYMLFFSEVKFKYIHDGVFDFSSLKQEDYNKLLKKNAYIFDSKTEWNTFKSVYLNDGQIPNIDFENQKIVLAYTNMSLKTGGDLYYIDKVRKNFLSLHLYLGKKGKVSKIKGFTSNAKLKNVMIYKLNSNTTTKDVFITYEK